LNICKCESQVINPYFYFFRPQYDLLDLRGRQDQQDLHDLFLSFQMKLRKTNPPLAEMIRRLCANTCPAAPADRTGACPVELYSANPYQGIPLGSDLSQLEGANTTN
jgi:hypothetical protein